MHRTPLISNSRSASVHRSDGSASPDLATRHMEKRCLYVDSQSLLDRRKALITPLGFFLSSLLPWRSERASAFPLFGEQADSPKPTFSPTEVAHQRKVFTSREGFEFDYPSSWVVAFDRSGATSDGAVVVVGDFRQSYLVVSVFRKFGVSSSEANGNALNVTDGHRLVLDVLRDEPTTMQFREISAASNQVDGTFDFEYEIQSCRGEIQEGSGGIQRCLGSSGQDIPAPSRRAIGRSILQGDRLLTITASAPTEKWPVVQDILGQIVSSFRRS